MIIKYWENTPQKFRSKLFWAWNGTISEDILDQQIACMKQMGVGGFYIHSRNGLKTPYLSDEWFEMVYHAAAEARKQHLSAAFYDEDRWPSGAAGGAVAASSPELAASTLNYCCSDKVPEGSIYSFEENGQKHHFFVKNHSPSEWFNNSVYPDVFNPESAKIFLRITHEKYQKKFNSFAEYGISEIFTDEPFYGIECFRFGNALPWSSRIPELYAEYFNEDLLKVLPGLFITLPDNSHIKTRWQFHLLISELFRKNFLRPISEWCEEHGLNLTGHLLGEDTLVSQAGSHGSNMAALQYFHQPGIDYLTGQRRHFLSVKQAVSTARQSGRKNRLAEIYGCTGWDFSLYDQRKQGDMLFALGINRHCLHLAWYNAEGERKRDFPGSLAWHSSHCTEYSRLEDRFARLHAVFEECEEVRDILLLNPVESAFTFLQMGYEENFLAESIENSRNEIADILLNANFDFDLGDEELLAEYAFVQNKILKVGEAQYRAVIIPETVTLRNSTWTLLKKFAAAGGTLFFAGTPPEYIDGEKRTEPFEFSTCTPSELPEKLAFCRRVSFFDSDNREIPCLLHILLRHKKGYFLFVHNQGYTMEQQVNTNNWRGTSFAERKRNLPAIKVKLDGYSDLPQEWNADNGSIWAGKDIFALESGESKLLFFSDEKENLSEKELFTAITPVEDVFAIKLTEPNVLLFDRAEMSEDGEMFHATSDIRRIDAALRKRYNISPRTLPCRQPWADTNKEKTIPAILRFSFFCDELPQSVVRFATEDDNAEILCNGERIEKTEFFYFDNSLKFFTVKNLHKGLNYITMKTSIDHHRTLENCFLLGDFGVEIHGFALHMTAAVKKLTYGDWCTQRLPFYSGAVDYVIHIPAGKKRRLNIDFQGSYAVILENTDRFWHEKNALYIPDGVTEITLRIYGSRRNSHGPFHVVQQLKYCNPASFCPIREEYHPHWQLTEYGIFKVNNNPQNTGEEK